MKRIFNYIVCTLSLCVAIACLTSGDVICTFIGFAWCAMLYAWGEAFPKYWRMFWRTNARILAHFDCL